MIFLLNVKCSLRSVNLLRYCPFKVASKGSGIALLNARAFLVVYKVLFDCSFQAPSKAKCNRIERLVCTVCWALLKGSAILAESKTYVCVPFWLQAKEE